MPVTQDSLTSRKALKKVLKEKYRSSCREIHETYETPLAVAILPFFLSEVSGDASAYLLVPVFGVAALLALPPYGVYYTYRDATTLSKFRRYQRSLVHDRDRNIRIRHSSLRSLRCAYLDVNY